ncbi:MAG: NifU N-terminal domain-containing protein [Acidimicrobiia bacterium]|nr:NifU N-terminal domain-containing protein [Acidimicrobiia bacterium]
MGQQIEVTSQAIGEAAIFDTDRSITGQDGSEFGSPEEAAASDAFPNSLAQRLFAADEAISTVFVASNVVTVTRRGGWNDATLAAASGVLSDFFLFYT